MDSKSKALVWATNLQHKFNVFCLEADIIIPREPVEYLRNQLLTAVESLEEFYSELAEDVVGSVKEHGPTEEKTRLTSHKKSNISTDNDDERRSVVNSSPSLLPTEPVANISDDSSTKEKCFTETVVEENPLIETSHSSKASILAPYSEQDEDDDYFEGLTAKELEYLVGGYNKKTEEIGDFPEAKFASKVEEYKLRDDKVTSSASASSSQAINSSDSIRAECEPSNVFSEIEYVSLIDPDLLEHINAAKARYNSVVKETNQPSGCQKLGVSLSLEDGDEFCSDSDIVADDHLSYLKTTSRLLNKKFTENHSCENASPSFDAETEEDAKESEKLDDDDAEEWDKLDDDLCGSDWEII